MLLLLLGPDYYSKKEYINNLSQKNNMAVSFFGELENAPDVESLSSQDLFNKPKIFVLKGLIQKFNNQLYIESFAKSLNIIILVEEKLDKRIAENKLLLKNKNLEVLEFAIPHGRELNDWILNRVRFLGATIQEVAVEELAIRLGRDNAKETKFAGKLVSVEEVFNLHQANAEIQKLVAFKQNGEITLEDVKLLVFENLVTDAFAITNAIADGKKKEAMELLNTYLGGLSSADEKALIIQLNALLSEQFRSIALVQNFMSNKVSENEILSSTGWKSGRLFIMKKIANKFEPKKVLETLKKFSALDEELKTAQTPPRTLLELILVQLF